MSLIQRVLIKFVLLGVSALALLEKKLIDIVKGGSLLSFNTAVALFIFFNLSYFHYMVSGLLYADINYTDENMFQSSVNSGIQKDVLGYSIVSLARTLPAPYISAKVALVVDKNTDKVLFDAHSGYPLASASTTKLMTALVALNTYKIDDTLEVPEFCTTVEGSKVGLPAHQKFSVDMLLHALLIQSGADAACTLSNGKLTYIDFVDLMNEKADQLGMESTSFTNPIGLDGVNGSHYSTAKDLYILTKEAMSNKIISDIVGTKSYLVTSVGEDFSTTISNTNRLLWEIPNTVGVKTGTTAAAGEVFIYEYFEKAENIDLVIIVMNSTDRFYDTQSLLNWTLSSYAWNKPGT